MRHLALLPSPTESAVEPSDLSSPMRPNHFVRKLRDDLADGLLPEGVGGHLYSEHHSVSNFSYSSDAKTVPPKPRPMRWGAVDIETTGLSCVRDSLCEVAFVTEKESWSSLVRVPRESRARLGTNIHGLRREQLRRAPALADVLRQLHRRMSQVDLVLAHNAAFDLSFLGEAFRRQGLLPPGPSFVCTLLCAKAMFPHLERFGLESLRRSLDLDEPAERHRALADATATARLFKHLLAHCDGDIARLMAAHGRPLTFRWSVSRRHRGGE